MVNDCRIQKIPYGGDYNPEQWTEDVWAEDMRLFRLAGIDIVTLNVFSWAALQPSEEVYDFSKLDRIMDLVEKKWPEGLFCNLDGRTSGVDGEAVSGCSACRV